MKIRRRLCDVAPALLGAALLAGMAIPVCTADEAPWASALAVYDFARSLSDANGPSFSHGVGMFKDGTTNAPMPAVYRDASLAWRAGADGVTLELDGANSRRFVDLGQGADNEFRITGAMTLFVRAKKGATSSDNFLFSKQAASGQRAYAFFFPATTEGIAFRLNGGTPLTYTSATTTWQNVWMDLVAVYQPGVRMAIYMDGRCVTELTTSVPSSIVDASATPLYIGASPYSVSSSHMNGLIEKAAIWNTVLSDAQIAALSVRVPPPDPVASYDFNNSLADGAAPPASDGTGMSGSSVTQATDAVYHAVGPSRLPGWDGRALRLDSGRFVDLGQGAANELQLTNSLTFFTRVKLEGTTRDMTLLNKDGTSGNRSYSFTLLNGGRFWFRLNGSTELLYTSATQTWTNAWIDLAAVFETKSRMSLYVNGTCVTNRTVDVPSYLVNAPATPLFLGAQPFSGASSHLTGWIERAAIWNIPLSDADIRDLSTLLPPRGSVMLLR